MFEALYTSDEMRAAEEGHDVEALMERAGRAVAEHALRRFPDAQRFAVVCGGGANGGDGRIAARVLREAGRRAEETDELVGADVVVDALFGTGFRGTPRPDSAERIRTMNASGAPIVSVDIASGVDASTGEVWGDAVGAALTVSFHGRKVGHVVAPGRFHAGETVVADIGLGSATTRHRLVAEGILSAVPRKAAAETKYSRSVLVVGGAPGIRGAAALGARAAFRADAGYVAIAAPEESLPVLETLVLEAVKRPLADAVELVGRARALALGPGLGRDAERRELVAALLRESDLPAVVDADALYELEPVTRSAPTVLTPHAGELARLLGKDSAWVDAHRLAAVVQASERYACVVLLKGPDTLVAAPDGAVWACDVAEPALATAGTGDVLTGIVAAFLAKGLDARTAAAAAAIAHARAARAAAKPSGLIASDVVEALPHAVHAAV